MKINERFYWAAGVMQLSPADQVLEIGCGAGLAISVIAPMLEQGHLTAIDRSRNMISMAAKRNQEWVAAGRATLLTGTFASLQLPQRHYNKIFAFNVGLFWKDASAELLLIERCLAPGGAFYLFFQLPPNASQLSEGRRVGDLAVAVLQQQGFEVMESMMEPLQPPAFCIIARPHAASGKPKG